MAPLIEVRNLRYRYDDGTNALDGVDFTLEPGETVAVLGANGSGKTTFVLHLIGLLNGQGDISVCGLPVKKENFPTIRQRVGMLFQESDEQLFMPTVLEDVAFGPLNLGLSQQAAEECALESLRVVGMSHAGNKAPYHLSAGEKRRVALAGILAMKPEILVLDEPTTFLDPAGQRELIALLHDLPQTKLLVTHDVPFARILATRAVFFVKGRIVDNGPLEGVVERHHWTVGAD